MKTTIATRDLIGLLTDLIATAGDGPLAGVHLRTMAGYWRDEPGRTNLLAGVSSSGVVGGHTWALASGTIEPTVWSIDDARAVIAVFKPAVKMHGPNHTVDIEVDSDRHITVRETPALFDAGSELAFTGWDPAEYPYGPIAAALTADGPVPAAGDTGREAPHTTWGGTAMRALLTVEKRRGANLRLWKLPATGRHLAQIGDEWRGFIFARTVDPDEVDLVEPTSDLNVEAATEDSESAVAEWSERMRKGLGIPPIPPTDDDDQLPDDDDPTPEDDD
ncbi:hypothetical protein ACXYTP_23525 [Tsukamurella ocularis]